MFQSKKLKRGLVIALACTLLVSAAGTAIALGGRAADPKAIYKLDFADPSNRGKNTAGSGIADATIVSKTGLTYKDNDIQGGTSLNLKSEGHHGNYVEIPGQVLNNESITIAGWFKVQSGLPGWSRMLEINNRLNGSGQYSQLAVMPVASNYYNGLHVNTVINNQLITGADNADNMLHQAGDPGAAKNTPKANYILPVYDTWVHYAYELTPEGFSIYQNGVLQVTKAGNFTASQFYSEAAKITLGATFNDGTADFSGGFADIRIYDEALSGEQIKSEYNLSYKDFLTTSYDFENGMTEGIRGYDATPIHTATTAYDEARGSNVLVLDGGQANTTDTWTHTSLELPKKTLHGHNQITFSADVFIDGSCGGYARIFDFAPLSSQSFSLGAKWGNATSLLFKFTTHEARADQTVSTDAPYNKWVNITVTVDGSRAVIYIDGIPVAQNDNFSYNNAMFWEECGSMTIGAVRFWGDKAFVGKMDNIKIYQTALTEKEVMMELGITTIEDDAKAVAQEKDKLNVVCDADTMKLDLPTQLAEGVRVSWTSSNTDIVILDGTILRPAVATEVILTATLMRGDVTETKTFVLTIQPEALPDLSIWNGIDLDNAKFASDSYYAQLMKTNLDYMFSLDRDRLLYSYRSIAGLDTLGAKPYGAWIAPSGNGAGQFEAHYIVALAKASLTMPDYSYNGETVMDRLSYMMNALKECQDAFALKDPANAGYCGALTIENFDVLTQGHKNLSDGTTAWVPWYFYHKNLEALLDVHLYAADEDMRAMALQMLDEASTWVYNKVGSLDEATMEIVLRVEYGGMAEVLYQTYAITKDIRHFKAAQRFEEKKFLDNTYNNVDLLTGLHSNTTIPKFLGCAAAYEATGNEYYKTIVINAFDMIMTRVYANGSTSRGEFWQSANELETALDTSETCCSYNMLKMADYLFRWTGDVKYADYFENVYTNHILASMAPDSGLKTYLTTSQFGSHKIYHTVDNSFWCCACTGMESFAKLPYGIYYANGSDLTVNMFYPAEVTLENGIKVIQSGNFYTDQRTKFTIEGDGASRIAIRVPDWADKGVNVTVNGQAVNAAAENGYIVLDRTWANGDVIEYSVPFSVRLDTLKGHDNYKAIMYGPLLFVADLGTDDINDVQGSQLNFSTAYTGTVVDRIVLAGSLEDAVIVSGDAAGNLYMTVKTLNQGNLTFRPFNQLFHNRFGMYFHYYDSLADAEADYTVIGNETGTEFDSNKNLGLFDGYSSHGDTAKVEDGKLVLPSSSEVKLLWKQAFKTPYVLEGTFAPIEPNGAINGGFYLMASGAGHPQDGIKAYNVQIEKNAGESTYVLNIFKFDNGYLGSVKNVVMKFPESGKIELHVMVKNDSISVFVNGSRNAALSIQVEKDFISAQEGLVGIRSQFCGYTLENFRIISADLTVGKDVLKDGIAFAEGLKAEAYTSKTWSAVTAALAEAKKVAADGTADQWTVNEADKALREALAGLLKRADTQILQNAVAMTGRLDVRNYTANSWTALQNAVATIGTYDLSDISEAEAAELTNLLTKALLGLQGTEPNTALTAVITAAEGLVQADYTAESWTAFQAVLTRIKALVPANAAEADAAAIELLQAQLALEVVSGETPDQPEDPEPTTPAPIQPGNTATEDKSDPMVIILAVLCLALAAALAGVIILGKKRKK